MFGRMAANAAADIINATSAQKSANGGTVHVSNTYRARQARLHHAVAGPRPKNVTIEQWDALQRATRNATWK